MIKTGNVQWSEELFTMRDVFNMKDFPVIMKIEEGYMGVTEMETFGSGEIVRIQSWSTHERVLGVEKVRGNYVSIPYKYDELFRVKLGHGKSVKYTKEMRVSEILQKHNLPCEVLFSKKDMRFHIPNADLSSAVELSTITLIDKYEERFLWGCSIISMTYNSTWEMFPGIVCIPLYIPVRGRLARGWKLDNKAVWENKLLEFARLSDTVDYAGETISHKVLIFDPVNINEVRQRGKEDDDEDDYESIYERLSPAGYVNVHQGRTGGRTLGIAGKGKSTGHRPPSYENLEKNRKSTGNIYSDCTEIPRVKLTQSTPHTGRLVDIDRPTSTRRGPGRSMSQPGHPALTQTLSGPSTYMDDLTRSVQNMPGPVSKQGPPRPQPARRHSEDKRINKQQPETLPKPNTRSTKDAIPKPASRKTQVVTLDPGANKSNNAEADLYCNTNFPKHMDAPTIPDRRTHFKNRSRHEANMWTNKTRATSPTRDIHNLQGVPQDISKLTRVQVADVLKLLNCGIYVESFERELIDGKLLSEVDEDMLREEQIGMSKLHAMKLMKFVKGWRP